MLLKFSIGKHAMNFYIVFEVEIYKFYCLLTPGLNSKKLQAKNYAQINICISIFLIRN